MARIVEVADDGERTAQERPSGFLPGYYLIEPIQQRNGVAYWLNEFDPTKPRDPNGPLTQRFAVKKIHGAFKTYADAERAYEARRP